MNPISEDDHWLDRIRAGEFAAIPPELTWLQSARLAHLLNGYDASHMLGLGDLHAWANARAEEAERTGLWHGSTIELWLCLFYDHRRWRHFGEAPTGEERALLDHLCQTLCQQLQAADTEERLILLWLIAANTAATER